MEVFILTYVSKGEAHSGEKEIAAGVAGGSMLI